MKKALTIALVAALALTLAVAPAAVAKKKSFAGSFKGKTTAGTPISLKVTKGGQAKNITGSVFVYCASLNTTQTKGGVDLFQPPAGPKLGQTVQNSALQRSAITGYDVTKTYTTTVRRAGRKSVSGDLRLSFSYFVPDLYAPKTFYCSGTTQFTASRG
jgi:opacity protein-like surface antigen